MFLIAYWQPFLDFNTTQMNATYYAGYGWLFAPDMFCIRAWHILKMIRRIILDLVQMRA